MVLEPFGKTMKVLLFQAEKDELFLNALGRHCLKKIIFFTRKCKLLFLKIMFIAYG